MRRPDAPRAAVTMIALIALIALVGAGCGGGPSTSLTGPTAEPMSHDEYVEAVAEALQPTIDESAALQAEASSLTTPKAFATRLEDATATYSETATDLAALSPPVDAGSLNERLVASTRRFVEKAESAQKALAKGDEKGGERYTAAARDYQEQLDDLTAEFEERGYDFESPDRPEGETETTGTTAPPIGDEIPTIPTETSAQPRGPDTTPTPNRGEDTTPVGESGDD